MTHIQVDAVNDGISTFVDLGKRDSLCDVLLFFRFAMHDVSAAVVRENSKVFVQQLCMHVLTSAVWSGVLLDICRRGRCV